MTIGTAAALALDPGSAQDASTGTSLPAQLEITFRHGVFGFPDCHRFVLLRTERDGFYWLQSLEHDELAFLLADPFVFFDDYVVELNDAEAEELEPGDGSELAVLTIVTLSRSADEPCTANLQGPLVLNLERGLGRQIVLTDANYGVRCPLDLSRARA